MARPLIRRGTGTAHASVSHVRVVRCNKCAHSTTHANGGYSAYLTFIDRDAAHEVRRIGRGRVGGVRGAHLAVSAIDTHRLTWHSAERLDGSGKVDAYSAYALLALTARSVDGCPARLTDVS